MRDLLVKHRHLAASLALTTALFVAGCGQEAEPPGGGDEVSQPPDCGECASETADLRETIQKIDGVKRIITIDRVTKRGITRLPGVRLELVVQPGTLTQVAQAVAEAAWKSRVSPLATINMVTIDSPGADPEVTRITYEQNQLAKYEADWGPRPGG